MSQPIQRIVPISAFAQLANAFVVVSSQNIPPTFTVAVGVLTSGTPGTPQQGTPGHAGFVAAVPAVPDRFDPHRTVQVQMTDAEWSAWTTQDDADYVRTVVGARLGFTAI